MFCVWPIVLGYGERCCSVFDRLVYRRKPNPNGVVIHTQVRVALEGTAATTTLAPRLAVVEA